MIAFILIALQVLLLGYFCYFGFYNYLYGFASIYKHPLLKAKNISNKKVAVVIVSYNEKEVIADTIKACEQLSYENKVIIVGDDSNDYETIRVLENIAEKKGCRKIRGFGTNSEIFESQKFVIFHRHKNEGFKAGNLKEMEAYLKSRGFDYMYLLDADWRPQKDAIERCLEVIEADSAIAFVQTKRVGYHGKTSFLQRCLALNEDGCYYVDQPGRQAVGDPILFTGCCTLFRLEHLYAAEGFKPGHLTEDIDLTNRFYLMGYKGAYLDDVENEGEVPPHYPAFRKQQERWTMGTARTLREYFWPIIKSNKLSWTEKLGQIRQNMYFTSPVAIEFSIILAFISVFLITAKVDSIAISQYQYYLERITVPYSTVLFAALASNFVAPLMVIIKKKDYLNFLAMPYATWLSWSVLHTYFLANIKGFFGVKAEWSLTPKTNRKIVNLKTKWHLGIKLANLATLLMLFTIYSIEWYELGWTDIYAFFWVPALIVGVFLS